MKNSNPINKIDKLKVFLKDYFLKNNYPPSIREICDYMGFKSTSSAHKYLQGLEDEGYITIDSNVSRGIKLDRTSFGICEFNNVPLVGEITAGTPIFAEENFSDNFQLPESLFRGDDDLFMLKVSGTSMIEIGINDGDFIVVKKQNTAINGQVVAALIDNENATIKRFFLENNRVRLHPENKHMADIYPDNIIILGIVKGLIRTEIK